MINNATMHHTRAELQGTIEFLFSEDAASVAAARLAGYLNLGNFLGFELKSDPKRTPTLRAVKGIVIEAGSTGAGVSLGLELMTKEVADYRKAVHALMASDGTPMTQAAVANAAIDTFAFTAPAPAKLNYDYPLTNAGLQVRHLSACTVVLTGGPVLTLGTDYIVDLENGLLRFINPAQLPANVITPTVTAPAIDSTHDKYMLGMTPMQKPIRRGYGKFIVYDSDAKNRIVQEMEPRPIELYTSGGYSGSHDNQSEQKLTCLFTSNSERWLIRP
jgi:hypothetical protein